MVTAKADEPSGPVHDAAARLFGIMAALVTTVLGPDHDAQKIARLTLLLSATIQGILSLVASRRISSAQAGVLLDDAVRVFVAGATTLTP